MGEESLRHLDELECKITFLERQVDDLNSILVGHQIEIQKILNQQKLLARKIRALETPEGGDSSIETNVPPHY